MMTTVSVDEHNGVMGTFVNIRDETKIEIMMFVPNSVEAWSKLEKICNNIIDIAYEASQEL